MFDILGEILETMKRNKLRTFLTGFAVAWGIFLLIVLLAAGNGLQNGVQSNMQGNAIYTVRMWPGWTSMPYKGLKANRRIRFDDRTVEFVRKNIPEVEYITGYIYHNTTSVSYGDEYGTWRVEGSLPEVRNIQFFELPAGRFLNDMDQLQRRKVAVIGKATADVLFKNGDDPIGKHIVIDGIAFRVVGVYETPWNPGNDPSIAIPMSTAKMLYDRGWGVGSIEFTIHPGYVRTMADAEALSSRLREELGPYLGFDPGDTSAVFMWNRAEQALRTQTIFGFVNMFLWVIGFASLMAGIVGVANIMLVTVKERTREIGIRKAIGATPWSIIKSVIIEAVFITTVAGYIGIMLGIGLTELISKMIGSAGAGNGQMTAFKDPTVSLGIVFSALVVLIVSGIVAGLIPSLKATKIRPIEAMRAD